ncbi:multicopper oxidase domain-containing protein [Agromyces sp. SYSU K20354]|uniref:multicopper oxidase family protein n=1 Tax=Agromyces cavernae TaxID=2898659 RepID=UPI001E53BE6C|nr:multicopper oxidase family protein [Agromyces cavernae]MCD2442695.1 multicopper oxidase domain-containing protein [Agromyces cavernae]
MTTAALLLLQAVAAIAGAGLWLAAGFTAGSAADRRTRSERMTVLALAAGGTLALLAAAVLTALLAGRGWWFAGEKVTVGIPFQIVGLAAGAVGFVWWLRDIRMPLARALMLGGGYAMAAGVLATWLVGYPPQPTAAGVLLAAVLLATGLTWALLAHRGRRAVVGFAGLIAVLLVGGLGWSWLSDMAAPSIEATGGHGHDAATPGGEAAIPVTDLRTPDDAPGDVHAVALTAARHEVTLASGDTIEAWGFGGDGVAGPELRVTEGELVEVTLENRDIDDGVTLHWHGYDVPNGEDGVAGVTQDSVAPGDRFTYRFTADQPGTYWYHTHQAASEGVRRGLYGMLVVEPRNGVAESLDLALPVHRIGGEVVIGATDGPQSFEAAAGDTVRLRVANTEQTPIRVTIAGAPFRVAAIDGRDIEGGAEVEQRSVRLGAGARADLVFTMPATGVRFETDLSEASVVDIAPAGGTVAADLPREVTDVPELDLLAYGSGARPDIGPFTAEGELVLDRMPRFLGGAPTYAYTVNGEVFPHVAPIEVREGDVVKITVANRGFDVHPMHVHGHHVLVLSRDGVAATGAPLWLDTVDVRPGEVWELALVADNPGIWMDHCHDLAHAAQGMMMTLAYDGVTTPFEHAGAHGNRPE